MITITTTSTALATKAGHVMAQEVLHNPNLNGAVYQVEHGDVDSIDSIDGADEIVGAQLYVKIFCQSRDK